MKNEEPLTEFQIIDPLAVEIQSAWEKAGEHFKSSRHEEMQAKVEVCKCGDLLAAAKERHRNAWPIWMETNLPCIPSRAAIACISTARKARIVGIENINLRQMVLPLCGVSQDDDEALPHINRDPDGTKWFSFFERAVGLFAKQLEFRSASEWTVAERVAFKRRAEPIVELYNQL